MKLKILLSIFFILSLILAAGYFFKDRIIEGLEEFRGNNKNDNSDTTYFRTTAQEEGFTFIADYTDTLNNGWEYFIKGNLPTPCYEADVEALIAESFPEQVTVTLTVTPPDDEVVCVQMVKEYEYEGTFNADKKASVRFNVVTKEVE